MQLCENAVYNLWSTGTKLYKERRYCAFTPTLTWWCRRPVRSFELYFLEKYLKELNLQNKSHSAQKQVSVDLWILTFKKIRLHIKRRLQVWNQHFLVEHQRVGAWTIRKRLRSGHTHNPIQGLDKDPITEGLSITKSFNYLCFNYSKAEWLNFFSVVTNESSGKSDEPHDQSSRIGAGKQRHRSEN